MSTTTGLRSVALLEHAVDYTSTALDAVDEHDLARPTPCRDWTLCDLLEHMDDALAAFTEAAALGDVDVHVVPGQPLSTQLVRSLRTRACAMLVAWRTRGDDDAVVVGAGRIEPGLVAAVGALEIAVHGWDVAVACGLDHPFPASLAEALLDVVPDVVAPADRDRRFAPARATDSTDPGDRLLALLGR